MKHRTFVSVAVKLTTILAGVGCVAGVGFGVLLGRNQITLLNQMYSDKAITLARSLDASITREDLSDQALLQTKIYKFIWLNPDILKISVYTPDQSGNLVVIVSTDVETVGKMNDDPEHAQAFVQDKTMIQEDWQGKSTITVHSPMHLSGKVAGVYEMVISSIAFGKLLDTQTVQLALLTLGVLSVAGILIIFLARNVLIQPIAGLIDSVRTIGEGNLEHVVVTASNDEIGQLAGAFDTMRERLLESQKSLGSKVLERTKDLEKVKKDLEEKMRQVGEQNIKAENTKLAMTNLLEDARVLEEDLKKERDTATAILSTMSEGLCVIDKNAKIVVMNDAAGAILGLDPKTCIDANHEETLKLYKAGVLVANDDNRPVLKTLKTGVSLSGSLEDSYQYRHVSGKLIPVSWFTVALKRGEEIAGEIITFHDISRDLAVKQTIEKQVIERTSELVEKNVALEKAKGQVSEGWAQLQHEKARLTASINSLSMGFILVNMEDHIVTMNPATQGIIGLSSRPEDLGAIEGVLQGVVDIHKLHQQCHAEQKPIHIDSVLFGSKFLRIFLAPIVLFTDKEEHIGTVILIEDITEAKVLERSREEFFSIASHELRTPLTAIRGNTSLIQEHYLTKLEPDVKEMIGDIHESSVRLIELVNDFLDTSRLEQKRLEFKKQPFNIQEIIKKAITEYQVTGSQRKLSLEYREPASPPPMVIADPDRVREVIINLIGNSLKFTEEGGITIETATKDGMVQVTVSDTGRGIPMENQSLLFHKFQQAGDSLFTRDTTKGTGLGLYISRLMIEGMGGKIWLVKSEADKGSTFAFTLPVAHT